MPSASIADLSPGDRIDHYIIREQIGEGGFAMVYLAEQTEPVSRSVALKIVKLGMEFEKEVTLNRATMRLYAIQDI